MENLLPDIGMASLLVVASGATFWFISRRMSISALPFLVVVPVFIGAGLILNLPESPLYVPSDGLFYQSWAYSLSNSWAGGPAPLDRQLWPGKGFWPLIIALFHFVVGPVTITLIVFNAIVFGATVLCLQKSVLLLTGNDTRWAMLAITLSSTPFILFGPSLLRESIFWLGTSGGVLALAYLRRNKIGASLASMGWGGLLLLASRPDAGVVFLYAFVGAIVVLLGFLGATRSALRGVATVAVLSILVVSAPSAFNFVRGDTETDFIDRAASALSNPNVETGFSSPPATGDSISEEPATGSNPPSQSACEESLVLKVACEGWVNLPYVLFGPFYWEYGPGTIWLVVGLSTLHFLALLGLSLVYLVSKEGRHWVTVGAMGVATVSLIMFASIMTNYGILIRFRAATEVILIPFAIAGFFALLAKLKAIKSRNFEVINLPRD